MSVAGSRIMMAIVLIPASFETMNQECKLPKILADQRAATFETNMGRRTCCSQRQQSLLFACDMNNASLVEFCTTRIFWETTVLWW